ncbi:transposase IS982 [Photorhabdus temperata subsp. temperata M1021]|uniref:Transposase n=1 Tax=Photorhabdus temperata J3 TaxID=1389415 RepID=U7QZ84_PHOTE|nr:transposase IS982 [Photorhabdus temperata subsp. temperata M1021]ERT12362.1 hypothetical protein O185_14645 [Photorhabdus temperata J3]
MYPSEIMTILILFHLSHYRDFKNFYLEHIWKYHHNDFPTLLSYPRLVIMLTVLGGLIAYCLKWKKPSLKVFYSEDDFSVTA